MTDHERITRARIASTQVRMRLSITRGHERRNHFDLVLWFLGATLLLGAVVYGGYLLIDEHGKDFFKDHPLFSSLGIFLGIGWGTVFIAMFGLALAFFSLGLLMPHKPLAMLWRFIGRTMRERRYLEALETSGEVTLASKHWRDGDFLREIAKNEPLLDYDGKRRTLSLKEDSEELPESCPKCSANLGHPEPGIRRCDYCEFERYDEPPATSKALAAARKVLGAVDRDRDSSASRRELWLAFKKKNTIDENSMIVGSLVATIGFGLVGELGAAMEVGFITGTGRVGGFIFGFTGGIMTPVAAYRLYARRFREFQPGIAAYDTALAHDIIATLAAQGRMKLDALAAHLEVSRKHLEQVLSSLRSKGASTLYRDTANDMLISLHASAIDNSGCPACGGQLQVSGNLALECQHCGGYRLVAS